VITPDQKGESQIADLMSQDLRPLIEKETPTVRQAVAQGKAATEEHFSEFRQLLRELRT
jgi:hypothetical protein